MEEDPASSGAPAEPEALSDAVLAKLDSFFDSNGLSGFGKAMAKQWIVTALSGGFPAGSCDRVVKWLLQQLSGKRTW